MSKLICQLKDADRLMRGWSRWIGLAWIGLAVWAPAVAGQAIPASEMWQKAVQTYLDEQYSQSVSWLLQYLKQESQPEKLAAGRLFLADVYRLSGDLSQAADMYQQVASANPNGPLKISARFRVAEMAYNAGDFQKAADIFRSLAYEPQADFLFPQIRLAWVKSSLKLQHLTEAQNNFSDLTNTLPRSLLDPEIKFLFAIMKEYQGQKIDALKIYQELEDNSLAQLFAGAILESQGRFMPAVQAYNQAQARTRQPSHKQVALYFKARAFYKSGDFLSAEKLCQDFLRQYPHTTYSARSATLLLLALLAQARFQDLLLMYARWQVPLDALTGEDLALVKITLAEASLNLDHYLEAIGYYQAACPFTNKYRDEVLLKLSYAYMAVQDYAESYRCIRDYFQAATHPKPLAHLLSVRVSLQQGHFQPAFRSAQILVEQQDSLAELALYFISAYYLDNQQPKTLVEQWALLEKGLANKSPAIEYREAAAWARLMLAEAYYQLGNYILARAYYQKAQDMYFDKKVKMYVLRGLTWCSFQQQLYPQVLAEGQQLLKLKELPEFVTEEIYLLRGHAYFNLQQYSQAVTTYQEWLKTGQKKNQAPAIMFQIGWAHYLSQNYLDAIETWQELAQAYPQSPESQSALYWMADTYFQANENRRARDVYETLLSRNLPLAERRAYELRIAQTYYNEKNDTEAIRRFTALLVAYPDSEEAFAAQKGIEAASYRIADQLDYLAAFQEFMTKFPESNLAEDIQYRIGEAYFQKSLYDESLQAFLQFVLTYTKSPRTPNAQYYIAACQEQLNHYPEAILQAEAFIHNYPQHELAPEMLFRLASNEFQVERLAAAAEHFAACGDNYDLKEYRPRAWYNAAVTYEKLRLPEAALIYYGKLVETYPQDANAATSLSRLVLLHAAQQNTSAVEANLLNLEKTSDQALLQRTWLALASIYQEQDVLEARQSILQKVMDQGLPQSEEYSVALVELASLYETQKAWTDAIRVYKRLASITSQVKWRQAAQKRVKLLKRILEGNN